MAEAGSSQASLYPALKRRAKSPFELREKDMGNQETLRLGLRDCAKLRALAMNNPWA